MNAMNFPNNCNHYHNNNIDQKCGRCFFCFINVSNSYERTIVEEIFYLGGYYSSVKPLSRRSPIPSKSNNSDNNDNKNHDNSIASVKNPFPKTNPKSIATAGTTTRRDITTSASQNLDSLPLSPFTGFATPADIFNYMVLAGGDIVGKKEFGTHNITKQRRKVPKWQ
jgi:hypothetical protein